MIQKAKLHEFDHLFETSNLTTIYVPPVNDEQLLNHTFTNLRNIIKTLRGPNGCSWDQKQTHQSLRKYALEEVYELIDAINKEDDDLIVEELGDLLLQIMLHSQIGEDSGYFTINDVIKSISEKMIHRHPHVFSNDRKKQNKTWDELKAEETKTKDEPLLRRVLNHLPALQKAYDLQKEADKVGFNWESVKDGWRSEERRVGKERWAEGWR